MQKKGGMFLKWRHNVPYGEGVLDDKFNLIATADESSINRKNNISAKDVPIRPAWPSFLRRSWTSDMMCVCEGRLGVGNAGGLKVRELDFAWISVWIASSHALFKHGEEKSASSLANRKMEPCATYRGFEGDGVKGTVFSRRRRLSSIMSDDSNRKSRFCACQDFFRTADFLFRRAACRMMPSFCVQRASALLL